MKNFYYPLLIIVALSCTNESESNKHTRNAEVNETVDSLIVDDTLYQYVHKNVNFKNGDTLSFHWPLVSSPINIDGLDSLIYMNLNYASVMGESIDQSFSEFDEYREGLSEVSYSVEQNKNGIFSIRFSMCYRSLKTDCFDQFVNLNLIEPGIIVITDLIIEDKLEDFYEILIEHYADRLRDMDKRVAKKDEEVHEFLQTYIFEFERSLKFTLNNNGVTFYYLFEFPSFAELYEPDGLLELPWRDITDYLKKDSPVVNRLRPVTS